ncbi:hypothetical protein L1049_002655 [Liquidambar formosana]|uniref:Uncharacterized protein n=1 Tax=Liquidambar formosana TaxID=63359 RepID=A0AAP0NKJ9_LIQFO
MSIHVLKTMKKEMKKMRIIIQEAAMRKFGWNTHLSKKLRVVYILQRLRDLEDKKPRPRTFTMATG